MITIALFRDQVNDFIGGPVVSAKDMAPLLLPGCGDAFLTAPFHPAGNQNGQPT